MRLLSSALCTSSVGKKIFVEFKVIFWMSSVIFAYVFNIGHESVFYFVYLQPKHTFHISWYIAVTVNCQTAELLLPPADIMMQDQGFSFYMQNCLYFLVCRWDCDFVGCVGAPQPSPGTNHCATQGFLYGRGRGPFRHAQCCTSLAPPQHPVQSHHRVRQCRGSFSTDSKCLWMVLCAFSN